MRHAGSENENDGFVAGARKLRQWVHAFVAVTLFSLLCSPTSRASSLPLEPGERLVYRVSWAVVLGAGAIKIEAHADPAAPDQRLIVTSNTATRWLARALLPFDATSESVFDVHSAQLLGLREESNVRGKLHEHSITFDYATRQARYLTNAADPRLLPIPEGDPVDLIMGLLETRSWNLKPGEKRNALILFDADFYELTIHFARYEDVQTALGPFKTVVLEPRMDRTAPKGMFKRGSRVRVWIAQDRYRLPVKFEVEFKIGTGTATLESYTPPSAPKPADSKSSAANAPAAGTAIATASTIVSPESAAKQVRNAQDAANSGP